MVENKTELKTDVRNFTQYGTDVLSNDGLDTSYRLARRHIRVSKSLGSTFDFYDTEFPERQEALFWWTCLFSKVQVRDLDTGTFQAGAIDDEAILAKDDDEVTLWYRQARSALRSINGSSLVNVTSPTRSERSYEAGTYDEQDGTGGSEVDATNL